VRYFRYSALQDKNLTLFCAIIQSLLAHIPYTIDVKEESFYHALLHMICILLQINAESEIAVARSRADMVIQTGFSIYVFELKLNASPQVALAQIYDRRCYEKYLLNNKELYLVELSFHYETKTITHAIEKITL
jgi:hypothetical protein